MTTTSVIEAIRGLLLGQPVGTAGIVAMAWLAGIALASYLWSRSLLKRV